MGARSGDEQKRHVDLLGPTPATYSYTDAMLKGAMTPEELERVRSELFGALGFADTEVEAPPVANADASRFHAIEALLEQNDCGGALELAERLLAEQPDDASAKQYVATCRELVCQAYLVHLCDGAGIVSLCVNPAELRALRLDKWSAFLVSCVDGASSVDDVVDVSALPRLDALRVLYDLVQRGVARLDPPRGR